MEVPKSQTRNEPTSITYDIGDGLGPQPVLRIPQLGSFETAWEFYWGGAVKKYDGVEIEVTVDIPDVGTFHHFAHAPFSLKNHPGPVYLQVTRTEVVWKDFKIGMAKLRQGDQVKQINAELESPEMRTWLPFLPTATLATKRPGRKGKRLIEYAELANRYVQLVESGDKYPNKTIAAERSLSVGQIRNLIWKCREKSLLTKPPSGKAGGTLTKHCRQVLSEHRESRN
jgi:hypothetical protein